MKFSTNNTTKFWGDGLVAGLHKGQTSSELSAAITSLASSLGALFVPVWIGQGATQLYGTAGGMKSPELPTPHRPGSGAAGGLRKNEDMSTLDGRKTGRIGANAA